MKAELFESKRSLCRSLALPVTDCDFIINQFNCSQASLSFAHQSFNLLVELEDFPELTLGTILALLKSDDLSVASEEVKSTSSVNLMFFFL
jgi:hypothetical protein